MDHYKLLSLQPDASDEEIRAAYRREARLHHPDGGGPADAVHFRKVREAYEVLSDPRRRAAYDLSRGVEIPVLQKGPASFSSVYEVPPGGGRVYEVFPDDTRQSVTWDLPAVRGHRHPLLDEIEKMIALLWFSS